MLIWGANKHFSCCALSSMSPNSTVSFVAICFILLWAVHHRDFSTNDFSSIILNITGETSSKHKFLIWSRKTFLFEPEIIPVLQLMLFYSFDNQYSLTSSSSVDWYGCDRNTHMLWRLFTCITTTLFKLFWIKALFPWFVKYELHFACPSFIVLKYKLIEEKLCIFLNCSGIPQRFCVN